MTKAKKMQNMCRHGSFEVPRDLNALEGNGHMCLKHRTGLVTAAALMTCRCLVAQTLVSTWTVVCQVPLPLETVQGKDGQGNGSKFSP